MSAWSTNTVSSPSESKAHDQADMADDEELLELIGSEVFEPLGADLRKTRIPSF